MKRIAAVSLCLVTSVILTAGPVMAADPSGAGPASVTGGPSNVGVVIRTPAEQTFFELKSKIVADYALVRAGTLGRSALEALDAAKSLGSPQQWSLSRPLF